MSTNQTWISGSLGDTDGWDEPSLDTRFLLPEMVKKPTGFTFPINLTLFKTKTGLVELRGFDIESLHPLRKGTGKAYYVAKDGADTNDGLTRNTAFLTFNKAYGMADIDILYVAGGEYYRRVNFDVKLPARDIKMIAFNGEKVSLQNVGNSSSSTSPTVWTDYGGGVYTTVRGNTVGLFDTKVLDEYGNPKRYVKKTSIAEVQATAGTWYIEGSTVYVHTLDGIIPVGDETIKVGVQQTAGWNPNNTNKYYFEGITFEMASYALRFVSAGTILFKNCGFNNSSTNDGLQVAGATLVVTENCTATGNLRDGFNYDNSNFMENGCKSYANGLDDLNNTNNGSTSHGVCKSVRINGMYFENKGPNVVDVKSVPTDVNDSWVVSCTAYGSKATDASYQYDFQTEGQMWLEQSVAYGTPFSTCGSVAGKVYIKNNKLLGGKFGTTISY